MKKLRPVAQAGAVVLAVSMFVILIAKSQGCDRKGPAATSASTADAGRVVTRDAGQRLGSDAAKPDAATRTPDSDHVTVDDGSPGAGDDGSLRDWREREFFPASKSGPIDTLGDRKSWELFMPPADGGTAGGLGNLGSPKDAGTRQQQNPAPE